MVQSKIARMMGTPAVVAEVRSLSPRLRWVRFTGDFSRASFSAGDKVKLQLGGVLRSYTPARFDAGRMDIIFHLHGSGAAAHWAAEAAPGQAVSVVGPAPSMPAPAEADWTLFLGDETTLGLALALVEAVDRPALGAIELDASDCVANRSLGLTLTAVPRQHTHGAALLAWLERFEKPEGRPEAFLSGEASMVLALRNALLGCGWGKSSIRIKPYWSLRGKAHRKRLEKSVLRA